MLSQAIGYAATALARVAASGGGSVLIKDIAEDCEMPQPYLAKIVNSLARKGFLSTQRGVGGGVTLAKPADKISLHDLAVALDDPILTPRCMLGVAQCSDERACPAHEHWTATRARTLEFMRQMTVADIAAFETRRRWRRAAGIGEPSTPQPVVARLTVSRPASPPPSEPK